MIATILSNVATRDKPAFKITIDIWEKKYNRHSKTHRKLDIANIMKQFQHNKNISYRVVKELNGT